MLYNQSKEQLVLKFNAGGSDNTNWFSQSRLRQSPWEDLHPSTPRNSFSIRGDCISHACRDFFINRLYVNCPGDKGWLMIGGRKDCDWEKRFPGNAFVYSKIGVAAVWNNAGKLSNLLQFSIHYYI